MGKNILKVIEESDFISMDTSALMEIGSLKKFVSKYEPVFIKYGRIIFVYKEVIRELNIFMAGEDATKRYLAGEAMDIMKKHPKLFRFQPYAEDVAGRKSNSFIADQKFLSVVALYKTRHTQLFISNDKDLLDGILSIDQIEAVHGKPVYTARLGSLGTLLPYELQKPEESPQSIKKETVTPSLEIGDIEEWDDEDDYDDGNGWVPIVKGILSAAVLAGFCGLGYALTHRNSDVA